MTQAIEKAKNKSLKVAFEEFKTSLNDPEKLAKLFKLVLFKIRYEQHLDLLCLPRGKESPNHDYAILFHSTFSDGKMAAEDIQAVICNFMINSRLPLKVDYRLVRKDGVIYSGIFLDVIEPKKQGEKT